MALSYSMDKIGPMCRTADDCGLVLSAIAGHDPGDLGSLPAAKARFAYQNPRDEKPVRVGWVKDPFGKGKRGDAELESASAAARELLKKTGIATSEIELPDGPFEIAGGVIISGEAATAFDGLISSADCLKLSDPVAQVGGFVAQHISAPDFLKAMRVRAILQKTMQELFEKVDVLMAPTLPTPATPLSLALDDPSLLDFGDPVGGIGNLCGLPALSVPCGFSRENLPLAVQFVGAPFAEDAVLAVAHAYQSKTEWHKKRPALQ
jgi:aspartyl-tRNA(Asn)/glutamyl-tRNA(Gln) amidotransferase subunit A